MFHWKWLLRKYFSKNDLRENILRKKKEKREIKIRKIFFPFQIRKTFYRKMTLFSVDQENIFSWPLIFRETNNQKYWKYFPESHFQLNKRTPNMKFFPFSFLYFSIYKTWRLLTSNFYLYWKNKDHQIEQLKLPLYGRLRFKVRISAPFFILSIYIIVFNY